MLCSKCGKENKEAARWCGKCGEKLLISRTDYICREPTEQIASSKDQLSKNAAFEISTPEKTYCAGCGKERKITDKFCGGCGEALFINFHAGAVPSNDENRIIEQSIYKDNQGISADTAAEDISFQCRPSQITPSQVSSAVKKNPIDVIYILIIILPMIIAIYMMVSVLNNFNNSISNKDRAYKANLKQVINNIESKIIEKKEKLKQIAEIGPEPDWLLHPFKHIFWKEKKEMKEKLEDELMQLQIFSKITTVNIEKETENIFRDIWDSYVQPVLEFFLIWAIFLFSLNRFCRFLLIKGHLGVTKV